MYVSVSNLHFPKMKLASEKPPEAVIERVIFQNFPGGVCPHTPLNYAVLSPPSLIPYGKLDGQDFSCFLQPCTMTISMRLLKCCLKEVLAELRVRIIDFLSGLESHSVVT